MAEANAAAAYQIYYGAPQLEKRSDAAQQSFDGGFGKHL